MSWRTLKPMARPSVTGIGRRYGGRAVGRHKQTTPCGGGIPNDRITGPLSPQVKTVEDRPPHLPQRRHHMPLHQGTMVVQTSPERKSQSVTTNNSIAGPGMGRPITPSILYIKSWCGHQRMSTICIARQSSFANKLLCRNSVRSAAVVARIAKNSRNDTGIIVCKKRTPLLTRQVGVVDLAVRVSTSYWSGNISATGLNSVILHRTHTVPSSVCGRIR